MDLTSFSFLIYGLVSDTTLNNNLSPCSRSELLHNGLSFFLGHVSMHRGHGEICLPHLFSQPVHLHRIKADMKSLWQYGLNTAGKNNNLGRLVAKQQHDNWQWICGMVSCNCEPLAVLFISMVHPFLLRAPEPVLLCFKPRPGSQPSLSSYNLLPIKCRQKL